MIKKLTVLFMLISIGFSCTCKEETAKSFYNNIVIEGKLIKDANGNEIKDLKYIDGNFVYGVGKWGGTND